MLGFRHVAAAANGEFVFAITESLVNPDIHALAVAAGWNEATRLVVEISAPDINTLMWLGSYPAGRRLIIRSGTRIGATRGGAYALRVNSAIEIENYGRISACGGEGGRGGSVRITYQSEEENAFGGWGGLGEGYVAGTTNWQSRTAGNEGATVGIGPSLGPSRIGYGYGGTGGRGGASGQAGSYGTAATVSGTVDYATYTAPATPSNAGNAVSGNSFITWIAQGTIVGGGV